MARHAGSPVTALTPAQKKAFARDGFVVLPAMIPRERVDAALRDINHRLGKGEHPGKDGYADSVDYLSEYVRSPAVMDLVKATPLRELASSLLGANKVEPCTQAQVVLRFPAKTNESPATVSVHIDGMYDDGHKVPIVRYSFCAGVLLSDVPRPNMGNLVAYPGTHRTIAKLFKDKGLGALRKGIAKSLALPEPAQVLGKAGDVVLFHFQTAHDKARNDSPEIRYTAYFRFWHVDAWHDKSPEYLKRALTDVWLEWPGMRSVHGA